MASAIAVTMTGIFSPNMIRSISLVIMCAFLEYEFEADVVAVFLTECGDGFSESDVIWVEQILCERVDECDSEGVGFLGCDA